MTETEAEEMAVRKRRAEGTPCVKDSFEAWKVKFDEGMVIKKQEDLALEEAANKKRKEKVVDDL